MESIQTASLYRKRSPKDDNVPQHSGAKNKSLVPSQNNRRTRKSESPGRALQEVAILTMSFLSFRQNRVCAFHSLCAKIVESNLHSRAYPNIKISYTAHQQKSREKEKEWKFLQAFSKMARVKNSSTAQEKLCSPVGAQFTSRKIQPAKTIEILGERRERWQSEVEGERGS